MKQFVKLDSALADAMKPSCQKYGFITYRIIAYWSQIVGEKMASLSSPLQIIFEPHKNYNGTLLIATSNPGFALEIQSSQNVILSKISTYFGYQAVSKIRIKIMKNHMKNT